MNPHHCISGKLLRIIQFRIQNSEMYKKDQQENICMLQKFQDPDTDRDVRALAK